MKYYDDLRYTKNFLCLNGHILIAETTYKTIFR